MNKKTKSALGAAALCAAMLALGGITADASQTVWVLSGKAVDASGEPQVLTVGKKDLEKGPAKIGEMPAPLEKTVSDTPVTPAKESLSMAGKNSGRETTAIDAGKPETKKDASRKVKKATSSDGGKTKKNGIKGEKQDTSISKENPLVVKADAMEYNSTTGDVDISGRVDMRHMQDVYETEHVYGNSKTQQYTIPVPVTWTSPDNVMHAKSGTYDGKAGVSTFDDLSGWNQGKYYFQGKSGTFDREDNHGVVENGYFTTKHAVAKVPDYRIEAESIDIYPNDHYTAHNVSLFIKNTRLITMSTYNGSLKHDNSANLWTLIPRPSYDSDNGVGLENSLKLPLGGVDSDFYFYSRLGWYTKAGFKPDVGFQWNTAPGTFKLRYAKEESSLNDDHVWVEMRPSFSFDSRHFYIPNTNFYVGAQAEVGNWKEGSVSGSHKLWNVYLSHDPITLGSHFRFNWRMGYLKDYYGYNDSIRRNQYYSVGLDSQFGAFSSWVSYTNNEEKGETPYSFDTYDMTKPLIMGGKLQLTPLDAIGVSYSIDTINGHLEHRDYTYYRDLHSFYGWVRYRDIDGDLELMIQPKDFSF